MVQGGITFERNEVGKMCDHLSLDFVLSFCQDKIPRHGEDSYCYSFCDVAGLLGAFDGCGGAGAKKHDYYSGHTEAYMASRFCAGVFYDCFRQLFPCRCTAAELTTEVFAPEIMRLLNEYEPPKDDTGFAIKGASVRTLPSTAAVALIQQKQDGSMLVTAIWAGDSRVYIMDSQGLAQLTVDDTTVPDPMLNVYEDGALRNVLCSNKPAKFHCRTVSMQEPFVVFSATDGCFGYLSTPMEFEGVLLETLLKTDCAAQWESELAGRIGAVAGDDSTLCLAAYGYGSYTGLQQAFAKRYSQLQADYLQAVAKLPLEDRESRFSLWETYRNQYMRHTKDGQA